MPNVNWIVVVYLAYFTLPYSFTLLLGGGIIHCEDS